MRRLLVFAIAVLAAALLAGCSDKQKEASELEQEMRDLEGVDSQAVEMAAPDSMTIEEPAVDASAVPQETMAQPERQPMPPAPRGTGYTVQVASCEDEEYARHLVARYTERGYEPFVTTISYDGETYFRVRIGNFDGYSEARALQAELQDRFSVSSWIDRLVQ